MYILFCIQSQYMWPITAKEIVTCKHITSFIQPKFFETRAGRVLELEPSDALNVGMGLAMSVFLILCELQQGHVSALGPKSVFLPTKCIELDGCTFMNTFRVGIFKVKNICQKKFRNRFLTLGLIFKHHVLISR